MSTPSSPSDMPVPSDPIALSRAALGSLPKGVEAPRHDPAALSPGIVHIGVGNFHRAHMGVYLDRLFGTGADHDWAIIGAGVRPGDAAMRERLIAQDCLTTVVDLDPSASVARVTAPMTGFLPVEPAAVIAALSDPVIRIASLTVTEGGYFIDPRTDAFDAAHPEIAADAASPDAPRTVFGILLAALRARRGAGVAPFTVLSCDNIPHNGAVTLNALAGLARLSDPTLAEWVEAHVACPNGMVDCITPATGPAEIALVRRLGIADAAPITCEPFRQWVLEDRFPQGRPALERVGVEFVADVAPYELMKLRLLNGLHAALGYSGALLGHEMVHEATADPAIRAYLVALATREIIPTLAPIEGVDYGAYLATLLDRFGNGAVGDTIARLCLDGSNRQPKFILPTLRDALAADGRWSGLALEVALWRRYCATAERLDDPRAEPLRAVARDPDPAAMLSLKDVFGDLVDERRFVATYADWSATLEERDARRVLGAYLVAE